MGLEGGGHGHSKRGKPGSNVDPGGVGLVAGRCTVEAAQPQVSQKPIRRSLWEQTSLEAYNELLFGCLDPEVAVLQQDKAEYDEARRQSVETALTVTLAVWQSWWWRGGRVPCSPYRGRGCRGWRVHWSQVG